MTSKTTKNNNRKKRILIVDDEPDVDTVLEKVFEQSGFNADSYDDPVLALENFKAGSYDLVLLDIKMPVIDGFHLYQEIKKIPKAPQCTVPIESIWSCVNFSWENAFEFHRVR